MCPCTYTICPAQQTVCSEGITACGFTFCPVTPTACFLEPTTCYQEPTTCYQEPTACYQEPTTCYQAPTTCYQEPTACSDVSTTCTGVVTTCQTDPACWPTTQPWPTQCVWEPTLCGSQGTVCPEVPTECPVIPTSCPPLPEYPDLIITDFWPEGSEVAYQIRNIGLGTAIGGHITALVIDGQIQARDLVDADLPPDARWHGRFDGFDWEAYRGGIAATVAAVTVESDYGNAQLEANEFNNARYEEWKRDSVPPTMTVPSVADITHDSATVLWSTNENADSMVRYDAHARRLTHTVSDASLVLAHTLQLTGLEPSTAYRLQAESADSCGNTASSAIIFFQTLSEPDGLDPVITLLEPGVCRGTTTIRAEASDETGIGRVEFYVDGRLVHTSYSAAREQMAADAASAPAPAEDLPRLKWEFPWPSAGYPDGRHTLAARAYDLFGRSAEDSKPADVLNKFDPAVPHVTIDTPDGTKPLKNSVLASMSASASTSTCRAGDPTTPSGTARAPTKSKPPVMALPLPMPTRLPSRKRTTSSWPIHTRCF